MTTKSTLTLPIVIGQKYVRRDGKIVEAKTPHAGVADNCCYVGDGIEMKEEGLWATHVFIGNGRIRGDNSEDPLDLIADHIEPAAAAPAATTEHPYAHILRAIADGQPIQLRASAYSWRDADADAVLTMIGHGAYRQQGIRIKPRTIDINGQDVPEPCREALERRQCYWVALLCGGELACSSIWTGNDTDMLLLERGLVHLTREAAEAHACALLSFTAREA